MTCAALNASDAVHAVRHFINAVECRWCRQAIASVRHDQPADGARRVLVIAAHQILEHDLSRIRRLALPHELFVSASRANADVCGQEEFERRVRGRRPNPDHDLRSPAFGFSRPIRACWRDELCPNGRHRVRSALARIVSHVVRRELRLGGAVSPSIISRGRRSPPSRSRASVRRAIRGNAFVRSLQSSPTLMLRDHHTDRAIHRAGVQASVALTGVAPRVF